MIVGKFSVFVNGLGQNTRKSVSRFPAKTVILQAVQPKIPSGACAGLPPLQAAI